MIFSVKKGYSLEKGHWYKKMISNFDIFSEKRLFIIKVIGIKKINLPTFPIRSCIFNFLSEQYFIFPELNGVSIHFVISLKGIYCNLIFTSSTLFCYLNLDFSDVLWLVIHNWSFLRLWCCFTEYVWFQLLNWQTDTNVNYQITKLFEGN